MNSSRTPNESALSEETDQPEKKFLPEIKRQVESTWIVQKNCEVFQKRFTNYQALNRNEKNAYLTIDD